MLSTSPSTGWLKICSLNHSWSQWNSPLCAAVACQTVSLCQLGGHSATPLLFSIEHFQMCFQSACIRGCKVTLVTFVWLFSIVRFQMCFKSACTRGFKVTSVAFVCLFPNVHFQMSPQMACLTFESCTSEESLLQLVLLLWPKIERGCSHIGFICLTFVNCAF